MCVYSLMGEKKRDTLTHGQKDIIIKAVFTKTNEPWMKH